MAKRKRNTATQIINHLRQAEVGIANGKTVKAVCRELGISEQTYYRWRREYNTLRHHSALDYRPPPPEGLRPDPKLLNLPALHGPVPSKQEAI